MPDRIALDAVNDLDREGFVAKFGSLYERSPWIAETAWHERPFGNLAELHGALKRVVCEASFERKLALIRVHPDLAGKAAVVGELTPESAGEQASAGLDRLSSEEYEAFTRMNREYRERFGFPMVVCVREHTKASILAQAEARLGRSRPEEVETALAEIAKIAYLRLRALVEDSEDRAVPGADIEATEHVAGEGI